MESYLCPVKEG